MECVIRLAERQDRDAVCACVQAAYSKYVERIGKMPAPMLADYDSLIARGVVSVLTEEGEIRGVLVMMPKDEEMFIENVAVDPRYQRQGLGRVLMTFAEQRARDAHLQAIRLYTNELMTENLVFYSRLGFEEESRREQDGYRRVYLRKHLT